jgi:hypothetical protein
MFASIVVSFIGGAGVGARITELACFEDRLRGMAPAGTGAGKSLGGMRERAD